MSENERVLVIGGTRGTGLLIAHLLLQHSYQVRVLARDPESATCRLDHSVEVFAGDITNADTLPIAFRDVDHLIFTAGVRSGRFASEKLVKMTDYQGVLNTLEVAKDENFQGRMIYLNSIGINTPSLAASLLNFIKGNTLIWRRRVEEEIRASGLDYTIIRVGFLLNRNDSKRVVEISQNDLPLSPRNRIARSDVAETFVKALKHPNASNTTFEIRWGRNDQLEDWNVRFGRLISDL